MKGTKIQLYQVRSYNNSDESKFNLYVFSNQSKVLKKGEKLGKFLY